MEDSPDDQFMRRAIELSARGATLGDGEPFAAVIVKDGEIIGEGWNHIIVDHDPSAHGEVVAIRNTCRKLKTRDLTGCDIYTSCEPCAMCAALIAMTGIQRIFYGTTLEAVKPHFSVDYTATYQNLHLPVHQRHLPARQLLAEEAYAAVSHTFPIKEMPDADV
ncbi:uncharacterized protein LOC106165098 [Lingula anatina]|uniref:Uncharacterized protein LOC106165098 n=1 Tax=Lingula anatina TaxID=7574 RepID=A0A1S3IL84_LINAN|nr:uncharacterized protein LOC106165098 [Lingula anatina]|eukprot:XP_013398646.1 uncharacterized protein LOC106165098 [Lingula anatina]